MRFRQLILIAAGMAMACCMLAPAGAGAVPGKRHAQTLAVYDKPIGSGGVSFAGEAGSVPEHQFVEPVPASDPCNGAVTVSFATQCHAPLTATQERTLKPKDTFRECADCPEMVVVPAGSFTMGSSASEQGRYHDNEGPQHAVTIRQQFAVGKFHVTRDQFAAFVNDSGHVVGTCHGGHSWRDPGFTQEGSHPVVCVSREDATAYAAWLSQKTGRAYRLPSEAEFEYAARAGTTTPYWWGSAITHEQANYDGSGTVPVGSFKPNPFGLYDVHGNAWEWMADCGHANYNGAPADGSAWTTGDCSAHVCRGGSWANIPELLRAATRGNGTTVWPWEGIDGFRLARDAYVSRG